MADEKQSPSETAEKNDESKKDSPGSSAVESNQATSTHAPDETSTAPAAVEPNKALPEDENGQEKGLQDDGSDVITIDDGKEPDVVKKTISDADFFEAVSGEEKEFYRAHRHEPDEVQLMKIQCTACWKQVRLTDILLQLHTISRLKLPLIGHFYKETHGRFFLHKKTVLLVPIGLRR
jgi:hypothetical protein